MKILIALVLTLNLYTFNALVVRSLKPLEPSEEYTHNLIVDEDNPNQFNVFWKLINKDEIQFEVHCKTTGWVGVGISPNGGMKDSDIAIGWVKDNKAYIKDCYATDKVKPLADPQQDFVLIEGAENDGYTILKYKRKLITCDEMNDKDILIGTQFMIFAWNNEDPVTGNNDWKYHGSNRIQRTTMLLNYKDESLDQQNILPDDTFTHTMRVNNIKVPAQDTYYFCDLFPIPKFVNPVHLIQFEILFQKNTKQHYHHILVYECNDDYEPKAPLAQECGRVPLPYDVYINCMQKQIIAWGIGGQSNYSFPKVAGYRMDPTEKPKYVLIEMHYDNPDLKNDIIDNSGIKFYFTETLRVHDLGLLVLGAEGNPLSLQIPPQSQNTIFTSICYPECTEKFLPDDGIYAVSALLHTHLAGRSVKTTLVRNGVAIRELFDNPNYDFNYQFLTDIEPVKLYKGDALITKCGFNTMDRKNFTYFGFSTYDEMCFDFLYYYPRIKEFHYCFTNTAPNTTFDFYRSLMKENLIETVELNEESFFESQNSVMEFFNTKVNISEKLIKRFEEFSDGEHDKLLLCGDPFIDLLYKDVKHYKPKESTIKNDNTCKSSAYKYNFSFIILLILPLLSLLF